uniref:Uncharacterized protein n=1 Tax=Arundo donax TaxID=35708 RepID=A0A0A9DFE6_ARUDO
MGTHLWAANCQPMMEGRVFILQVLFLLNQRNLWLSWLIQKRRRKKGRRESTRSQFELLGGQTCTTLLSFCMEDRGICLKKPYKYLMLSSGSRHLGIMSQCPDPFSLPLLVTEETLVRGLSVGEVTTRACALHKWDFR